MFSQKGGRMPAEIRRRKNNRPSCFIRRTEKQTQRRNGRTPAEIVAKRKTSVGFFAAPQSNRNEGTGERLLKSGEEKIIVRLSFFAAI